jgi:glycosyltransferase involved in cell wall biosynthesis
VFSKPKLIRTTTVALSLDYLLKGQLSFLNNHYEVVGVSGLDNHLDTVAKREDIRTEAVAMQRAISPVNDVISLWQLYRLFLKEKPQIVHSITPKAGLLSMVAAYFAGVPIRIHTFTGLIFPTRKGILQKLLIFMDRILCFCATNIYPEGQGVKNDLIRYKITTKNLLLLANGNVNGIDTAYFNPKNFSAQQNQDLKNSLDLQDEDFVFIFVGRMVGDKGINELISAFKKLSTQESKPKDQQWSIESGNSKAENQDNHLLYEPTHSKLKTQNLKLLLVGPFEPDLDPLLADTLEEISTNNNIISVGFQKDVSPYFAISDCLAFASYREGFPNVVMQAGAMGLPSIVTNINGCNEIIGEGQNGTIIPVKDSDALYHAMRKMAEDADFRIQLQQNARPMIVSRYEQQVVWDAILAEYKSLEKNV